jgi:hypothetical protein
MLALHWIPATVLVALPLAFPRAQETASAQGQLKEVLAQAHELLASKASFTDPEELRAAICETIEQLVEAARGSEDWKTAVDTLRDAAILAYETAGLSCAQTGFEGVLELLKGQVPEDNLFLLDTRSNLASTLGALGDPAAALGIFEQVLAQ